MISLIFVRPDLKTVIEYGHIIRIVASFIVAMPTCDEASRDRRRKSCNFQLHRGIFQIHLPDMYV